MAALVLRPPHSLDLVQLYTHVSENLPPYAQPRFLRLQVTSHFSSNPVPHPTDLQQSVAPKPHKGNPHNTPCEEKEQFLPRRLLFTPFTPGSSFSLSPPPLNPDFIPTPLSPDLPCNKTQAIPMIPWGRCAFLQLPWSPPLPQESLATTETFKQQKVRMAKEGFDPSTLSDPLYILDQAGGAYLPLTPARYSALLAGDLRI